MFKTMSALVCAATLVFSGTAAFANDPKPPRPPKPPKLVKVVTVYAGNSHNLAPDVPEQAQANGFKTVVTLQRGDKVIKVLRVDCPGNSDNCAD